MGGLKCRACRRYVLRWPHIAFLIVLTIVIVVSLLEITSW